MNESTHDLLLGFGLSIGVLICFFCWLNCNGFNICDCCPDMRQRDQESHTNSTPEYVEDEYCNHTINISPEVDNKIIL